SANELSFVIAYVVLVAILLVFKRTPEKWKGQFLQEKIAALLFKLVTFVVIPVLALRIFWNSSWASLGFTAGDLKGQIIVAAVLMLFFGGFNLLVGSAAKPLRERRFST